MKTKKDIGLIQEGLVRASIITPTKTALMIDCEELSYLDLVTDAKALSLHLLALDSKRIFLCIPNSINLVKFFFGVLFAGKSVSLLDPTWPLELIRRVVQKYSDCIFIGTDLLKPLFRGITSQDKVFTEHQLLDGYYSEPSSGIESVCVSEDSTFLTMFTSGSEGAPKSVERSHKSWVKSFDNSELEFGLNQDTTSLVPGPLSHGVALFGLLSGLYFGRTVVIQTKFDTKKILRVCESINSVSLVIVPSMVDLIIGVASEITYSSVKQIVSGGAKLLPVVRDRARRAFPEADIIEYYGASELSFVTVSKETEACPVESVGRVFIGAKLEVRDVTGNILDTGSAGEIWVKSDMLCTPSITPELSTGFSMEDGWATVRDLGFLNSEGFLFLQGRAGSVISTGGYIVYPLSVEKVLSNHPAIEDVTVFGFQDIRWGELVCAAIVLGDTKKPTQNELYHFCLQELEPYSCPRKWVFLDSIDKLSNGKINMSALHKYIT